MRSLMALLLLCFTPLVAQDADTVRKKATEESMLELTFRSPTPPVVKLILVPMQTGENAGRKTVAYSVVAKGVRSQKSYTLMSWDIGTDFPVIALKDLRIDDKGKLRCGDTGGCPDSSPGTELVLRATGMLGQPRRFLLVGNDKKPLAMGEAVPFPAIGKDGECSAEAVILRPNAAVTLLIGQGFAAGEVVKEESSSQGEAHERALKADPNGRVVTVVLPFVKGHQDGETSFGFQGSKCHPTAAFKWGAYSEERAELPASSQ